MQFTDQSHKKIKKTSLLSILFIFPLFTFYQSSITYASDANVIALGRYKLFSDNINIASDTQGNTYVANNKNNTSIIYKIGVNGKILSSIKLSTYTTSITVDTLGNIYTYDNNRIFKFKKNGILIKKWKPQKTPLHSRLFSDSKNNIYISTSKSILIYNSEGLLINEIKKINDQPNSFYDPIIISINEKDQILVKDSYSNTGYVYQIDSNGKPIKPRLNIKSISEDNENKTVLAYDNEQRIYSFSSKCLCIQAYTSDGLFLKNIGSYGSNKGQFSNYNAVIIARKTNNLIIAETEYNHRVQAISYDGSSLWSVGDEQGVLGNIIDVALDSMKNIYVLDQTYHRVSKFSIDGTLLKTWGSLGSGNGQFNYLSGIVVDHNDNIYIQDFYIKNGESLTRIQIFNSEGIYLSDYPYSWPSFDKNNNHYHLINKNDEYYIQKYDTNNNLIFEIKTELKNYHDYYNATYTSPRLLIDLVNNIYVSSYSTYKGQPIASNLTKIDSATGKTIKSIYSPTPFYRPTMDSRQLIYASPLVVFSNELELMGTPIDIKPYANSYLTTLDQENYIYSMYPAENSYIMQISEPVSALKSPLLTTVNKRNNKGAVTIKWQDRSTDEIGFKVYRCKVDANTVCNYELVATTPTDITKLRLAAPADFTEHSSYYYRVTAIKDSEESLATNAISVNYDY